MEIQSKSGANEPEDSADDVFTAPDPAGGDTTSHEPTENLLDGGTSYLPSHPEPQLPPEAPKVPPCPISLSDENYRRGNWGSKFEFLAVALCQLTPVGIYFIFHYYVYRDGGLVFIVPYMIMTFFYGFPVILLAISLGQFCSSGFMTTWKFMPVLKGVSVCVILQTCSTFVLINIILQLAYSFMFETLVNYPTLPWAMCGNDWNNATTCRDRSYVEYQETGPSSPAGSDESGLQNSWANSFNYGYEPYQVVTNPSAEYYEYMYAGGKITGVGILGAVVAFLVVFLTSMMGVKVVGKFCICLLAGSFVFTVILLIWSCLLPGAYNGFLYLFVPNLSNLFTAQIWKHAFFYVNFTLAYAFWPCVALASHNRFSNNCLLDTALLVMAFIFSPIMLAIIVFSLTSFLAHTEGIAINAVVSSGANGAFVTLPYSLSYVPQSNIWTMVWFGLFALNLLGSQVGTLLAMVSSILDLFGWVHSWRRVVPVTLALCVLAFFGSIISQLVGVEGTISFLDYSFLISTFATVTIVSVGLVWFYGSYQEIDLLRYSKDLQSMFGFFPTFFKVLFTFAWAILIPFSYAIAIIFSMMDTAMFSFRDFGFLCVGILILIIGVIIGALHEAWKHRNVDTYFTDYFYRAALPLPQWGPELDVHRQHAGYLPRDFTPQPYRLGHHPAPVSPESASPVQSKEGAPGPELYPTSELTATAPPMEPSLSPNETQL